MAAKKTHWGAIAGIAGAVILLWLFWPRKAKAGGSAGGPAPMAHPLGIPPKPPTGPGGGFGSGGGAPFSPNGGGRNLGAALKNWVNAVQQYGWAAAAQMPIFDTSAALAAQGIPLDPLQNFDTSQLSFDLPDAGYSGDWTDPNSLVGFTDPSLTSIDYQPVDWSSQNDFLVTQDISQSADLSSYGIDPYYGSDQIMTDYLDSPSTYASTQDSWNQYNSPDGNSIEGGY